MAELLDIRTAFAPVLDTPEQRREKQMAENLGLFKQGFAGTLAEARTNFQNNTRSSLQKAGSAINPDFDIRTNSQKYSAAVNGIDPESETAEREYIEATKQFMPSKLPALMDNIRTRRLEDEQAQFARDANDRAEDSSTRAGQVHTNLQEGWADATRQKEIQLELSEMSLDSATNAVDRVKTQKEYLLTTIAGKGEGYADRLEAMSPQEVAAEFTRVEGVEGQVAKGLRASITTILGEDHKIIELLKDMPASQLQAIQSSSIQGAINPTTKVIGDRENGWELLVTDPANPTGSVTVPLIGGTGPAVVPRAVQPLTAATREAVDNAVGKIDISNFPMWNGRVEDPQGNKVTAEALVERRAGDFFQRTKLTELELTDRVSRAAADLKEIPSGSNNYAGINAILDRHFPRPNAENLIDSSL